MLSDLDLEAKEREYFQIISFHLKEGFNEIREGLNSRLSILQDWYAHFIRTARAGYKASDLETGADRIFHHFFAPIFKSPNSTPIGSNLVFELLDAFLHIEIKTASIDNPADYKGKVNIGINQTSYAFIKKKYQFSPNLPHYYLNGLKPCLTYALSIIHQQAQPDIKALMLICIPNGQLYPYYGEAIVRSGKGGYGRGQNFRFKYAEEPYFKLLSKRRKEKIFRIELIYLDKDLKPEDITTRSDIPVHLRSF